MFFKISFVSLQCQKQKDTHYGNRKVIRILAIFITVAAFAIKVATHLMFPGASHTGDIPILILLTLSVCGIWRDALRTKKQNENPNE